MIIAKNTQAAVNAAIEYAQLHNYDIYGLTAEYVHGLYELSFYTDVMDYSFFVDAESREVLGFDCRPIDSICETVAVRCA